MISATVPTGAFPRSATRRPRASVPSFAAHCLIAVAGMATAVPIAAAIDALTTHVGILSVFGA